MIIKEWKKYGDKYKVSNYGDIISLNYNKTKKERTLKPTKRKRGYMFVNLYGKQKQVHRVVAEVFIPNPENKPFINHKDGDKTNNIVTNLEWCTAKENNIHAIKTGLNNKFRSAKHMKTAKENIKKATERRMKPVIGIKGNEVINFNSISEAGRYFNKGATCISKCCKGKMKSAYGYVWKYSIL